MMLTKERYCERFAHQFRDGLSCSSSQSVEHERIPCRGIPRCEEIARSWEDFDPSVLIDCPGLHSCATDPDASTVRQGRSPVHDVDGCRESDCRGVCGGGLVPKRAKAFDLPEDIWGCKHGDALVASGALMRRKIATGAEAARQYGRR